MGAASPIDLFLMTLAIGTAYGALAWRFFVVPAQRRRGAVAQQPVLVRVMPTPRLRLVVDNTASR